MAALHLSSAALCGGAFGGCKQLRRSARKIKALFDDGDDEGWAFAPPMKGDGFSFYGGKYSTERDKTDDWWDRGQFIYLDSGEAAGKTMQDPFFGLKLGRQSQVSADGFRWFYVEEGDENNPSLLLLHGIGSQAYSFRHVISSLASSYRTVAVDWLGFGFSDKPQSGYGFSYTAKDYAKALESLVAGLGTTPVSIVVQGHFAPAVVQFAKANADKVSNLILINPPVSKAHSKLPSSLARFTNIFLGSIFAQDPYKASDSILMNTGYFLIKEEDHMVYRKPYLLAGSAGFALCSIAKVLQSELEESVKFLTETLTSPDWTIPTSILTGLEDNWIGFKELQEFAQASKLKLVELPEAGHHAQEDVREELASIIRRLLCK